ncbi:MAG: T9SS type A sorting domain-containing protein, partial [Ignavibacteriae bacterium]|nr:T9SS type A sorting domain-containing protein [Ignavibacteriota bacterium]
PDSNIYNDTLRQTSVVLLGAYRNVLTEEFTSMTSPSCAYNNPALDRYIDTNFQNICAVKYHLGFPTPGIDSLYLADTVYQKQRANYYYVYAVPTTFLDGKLRLPLPYTFDSNLTVPFYSRFLIGSPLSLDVSDIRLPGDTIQTTVNINLLHTLASNNLRLRIYALERYKLYASSPGTNGEKNFYDIFRRAYPDSAGFLISNVAGNYQYIYKYHIESTWTDSLIYTLAFVQDDNKKEVLNCAKSRQTPLYHKGITDLKTSNVTYRKADLSNNTPHIYKKNIQKNRDTVILSNFNFEGFEGPFPPPGWSILNPDVGFTFEQLNGYNGPRFGGINCIKVPFYDYPNIGQRDTLLSVTFTGVTPLDSFRFDYSYAQYLSGYTDSLIVSMSTDGGSSFITIFQQGGYPLATSPATTLSYAPISSTQWVTIYFPMSEILPFNPSTPIPETYKLYQNYPNPFNPTTNFKFDLPHNVFVSIKIYDILGREITTIINQKMDAGPKVIPYTFTNLASGIYFYRITAGDFIDVKKMVFIK